MGLLSEGYVWITTDAIGAFPEALKTGDTYPEYLEGLLGTIPHSGQDTPEFLQFRLVIRSHKCSAE